MDAALLILSLGITISLVCYSIERLITNITSVEQHVIENTEEEEEDENTI